MSYEYKQQDLDGFVGFIEADFKVKGNEYVFRLCPKCKGGSDNLHKDKETFSVNYKTGAFMCQRAKCAYKGHFVQLARDFGYKLDYGYGDGGYTELQQKEIVVKPATVKLMSRRGISENVTKLYKIGLHSKIGNTFVIPFYDENGVLTSTKCRKADFKKGVDRCKEWFEPANTKPILFGMLQADDYNKPLIITEGQIDAMSVAEAGFTNCCSVPNGANGFTWVKYCSKWVHKFPEVIVMGDNERGEITLAKQMLKHFSKMKVRICQKDDYLGEKDANDILQKYGKDAVRQCIENAKEPEILEIKRLADVENVNLESMPGIKSGIAELDKVINKFYYGQLAVLTGKRGEGKSTFASQIIANAIEQNQNVLIYSGELQDFHFKNWLNLQIAGKDHIRDGKFIDEETSAIINKWYYDKAYIYDNSIVYESDDTEQRKLLDVIEDGVRQNNINLVLLDNLMTAMSDYDQEKDIYEQQAKFVRSLKKIAVKYNIVILLVAHPKKSNGLELGNDSISGSGKIADNADIVLKYERNIGEDKEKFQSLLGVCKSRLVGELRMGEDRIKLMYSSESKRIVDNVEDGKKEYSCFKDVVVSEPYGMPPV